MKIIVVSDTHRQDGNFMRVMELHHPDLVVHCGDAEGSEQKLAEAAGCPLKIVLGNNDFFSALPRELEFQIGKYKVWVTHGHTYCVSMSSEIIKDEAVARGADIVMYGHTHKPVVDLGGGVAAINPGSLSYPRQDGRRPSYIIMEIDREERAHYTIAYL